MGESEGTRSERSEVKIPLLFATPPPPGKMCDVHAFALLHSNVSRPAASCSFMTQLVRPNLGSRKGYGPPLPTICCLALEAAIEVPLSSAPLRSPPAGPAAHRGGPPAHTGSRISPTVPTLCRLAGQPVGKGGRAPRLPEEVPQLQATADMAQRCSRPREQQGGLQVWVVCCGPNR